MHCIKLNILPLNMKVLYQTIYIWQNNGKMKRWMSFSLQQVPLRICYSVTSQWILQVSQHHTHQHVPFKDALKIWTSVWSSLMCGCLKRIYRLSLVTLTSANESSSDTVLHFAVVHFCDITFKPEGQSPWPGAPCRISPSGIHIS